MARPATRSVLVGPQFGVFVWLLSRCPTVPVGCALSVRCFYPRRQLGLLTCFRCHQYGVRTSQCPVLRTLLGVFLVWLVLAVVSVGSYSQYTTAKPSCQVRGVFVVVDLVLLVLFLVASAWCPARKSKYIGRTHVLARVRVCAYA